MGKLLLQELSSPGLLLQLLLHVRQLFLQLLYVRSLHHPNFELTCPCLQAACSKRNSTGLPKKSNLQKVDFNKRSELANLRAEVLPYIISKTQFYSQLVGRLRRQTSTPTLHPHCLADRCHTEAGENHPEQGRRMQTTLSGFAIHRLVSPTSVRLSPQQQKAGLCRGITCI